MFCLFSTIYLYIQCLFVLSFNVLLTGTVFVRFILVLRKSYFRILIWFWWTVKYSDGEFLYIKKKMSCLLAIRTHNEELPYNVSMTYVYWALNLYVDSVHKRLVSNVLVTQGTSEIFLRHSCTSNRTVTFFIEVQVQRTFH